MNDKAPWPDDPVIDTIFSDGRFEINLEAFQSNIHNNKYTLVEFWASWCIPCRETNPQWSQLLEKYSENGFHILGVSLEE